MPEDIHDANVKEITDACYKVLSQMRYFSWSEYENRIKRLCYDVKIQKDKQGVMHGYTIMKGNSRYKASILGIGRDLMLKNIENTWKKLHKPTQVKTGVTGRGLCIGKPTITQTYSPSSSSFGGQNARVQNASTSVAPQSSDIPLLGITTARSLRLLFQITPTM